MPFILRPFIIVFVLNMVLPAPAYGQGEDTQYLIHLKDATQTALKKISALRKNQRAHQFYLNAFWQHSIVQTTDGQTLHFNGRFSVIDQAVQWQYTNQIGNLYSGRVATVLVGTNLFRPFQRDQIEEVQRNVFLQVLTAGTLSLYIHHYLDSKMTGTNSLTSSLNGTKEYFLSQRLLYQEGDGPVKNLKTRKKDILELFQEKKEEMAAYITNNDLKYNNEEDLIQIFNHFNQLPQPSFKESPN